MSGYLLPREAKEDRQGVNGHPDPTLVEKMPMGMAAPEQEERDWRIEGLCEENLSPTCSH